ncbi:hypothetical protein DL770_003230 [Monosporascus sp. CRB-9-2]|nr:hypothetical protein DL770_003230 [Monosporascus sp. CRB-9-2]
MFQLIIWILMVGTYAYVLYTNQRAPGLLHATGENDWRTSGTPRKVPSPTHPSVARSIPQDDNSMAIAFDVLDPKSAEAASISKYVTENWTPIGPKSPKLLRSISSFILSIEIETHFGAGRTERALELIRTC